jgi:hypothetical protein
MVSYPNNLYGWGFPLQIDLLLPILQPLQFALFSYSLLYYFAHDKMFFKLWLISLFLFQKMTKKIPKNKDCSLFIFIFFHILNFFSTNLQNFATKKTLMSTLQKQPIIGSLTRGLGEYKKANCES